jgi:hypothetical protein
VSASELGDTEFAQAAAEGLRRNFLHEWTDGRAVHPASIGVNDFSALGTFGGHDTLRTPGCAPRPTITARFPWPPPPSSGASPCSCTPSTRTRH